MKYCPQCRKQFTEAWITFCSDDGSILIEEFSPPQDPNWDPRIRPTQVENPSEQPTQWFPQSQPRTPGGWMTPDERPPASPAWQPSPAPRHAPPGSGYAPPAPSYARPQPSPNLAIASMVIGLVGLVIGTFCLGPIPGIVAVVLALVSLSQIKKSPDRNGGKPFAIVGLITGGISVLVYGFIFLFFLLASIFS